jgi:hypothetical protein
MERSQGMASGNTGFQAGSDQICSLLNLLLCSGGLEPSFRVLFSATEPLQVVELGGDAVQVADAVAVTIVERARVDLVHDNPFPPGGGGEVA